MERAAALRYDRMYLLTPDQLPFYERLGWRTHEVMEYRGETVTIMSCLLA